MKTDFIGREFTCCTCERKNVAAWDKLSRSPNHMSAEDYVYCRCVQCGKANKLKKPSWGDFMNKLEGIK